MTHRYLLLALAALAGACSNAAPVIDPPEPYWVMGRLCGEDDCDNIPGRWRTLTPVDVYSAPDSNAVVARLAPDEWVNAVEKKTLMTPLRGEVRVAGDGLAVGDVVYGPFAHGDEALEQVWRNGQRITIAADAETPQIDWAFPAAGAPMRVMWVRVEQSGGPGGWLRDPADFACMGEYPAEDEGC